MKDKRLRGELGSDPALAYVAKLCGPVVRVKREGRRAPPTGRADSLLSPDALTPAWYDRGPWVARQTAAGVVVWRRSKPKAGATAHAGPVELESALAAVRPVVPRMGNHGGGPHLPSHLLGFDQYHQGPAGATRGGDRGRFVDCP